jgi:hypothetical protein
MGENHARARDKKARQSEQDKHGQWGKSTNFLETRKREKVGKTNIGNGGKHTQARDEKVRKSEQGKQTWVMG